MLPLKFAIGFQPGVYSAFEIIYVAETVAAEVNPGMG
jgi:hypothetical protein